MHHTTSGKQKQQRYKLMQTWHQAGIKIMSISDKCVRQSLCNVARMGKGRGAYRILVRRPQGRRPLGRPRHRWENIKMDLQEVGWGGGGMDWVDMAQDTAPVNAVMNLQVP
jgi:hypothetical protein